jgi:ABC-type lipoprotein export system ATPase subunit
MTSPTTEPGLGAGISLGVAAVDVVRIYPAETASVAALRGLDLEIEPGAIVGVVGPSGSGKSTLLRLLAGLDRPSAGSLVVGDLHLERATDAQLARYRTEIVGVLDQHYWRSISPYATVADIVGLPLRLRGWPGAARQGRVAELLERIGLADRAEAYSSELSGGEQQRVAFAAALAPRPRLLLADEPTGELDSLTSAAIFEVLRRVNAELGTSVVIVTHDALVSEHVARTVAIRDGRTSSVVLRRSERAHDGEHRMISEEFAVLDRAGRLQLPRAHLETLGLADRVRLVLEDDHVEIWPAVKRETEQS